MKGVALFFTFAFIAACITGTVRHFQFRIGCSDYLKLAGDAPTVEKAADFLGKAVNYMESRGLTQGNSAILIKTPKGDVGIWYQQINGAYETVRVLVEQEKTNPGSISQLTKDNALMKVREVVLDAGKEGTEVTVPDNIAVFPYQGLFCLWACLSFVLAAGFWVAAAIIL